MSMKKKTPFKQMDSGLVQAYKGARQSEVDAYRSSGSAADVLTGISEDMFAKIKEKNDIAKQEQAARRKANREKTDKLIDEVNATGGSLGTNVFDSSFDYTSGLQESYDKAVQSGDKKEQAKIMQQLNEYSAQIGTLKELNQTCANTISENDLSANIKEDSKEYQMLSAFLDKNTKMKSSRDEETGDISFTYTTQMPTGEKDEEGNEIMEDVEFTSQEIESILKNNTTDSKSIADIRDQIIKAGDAAEDENASGVGYNYDPVKMTSKMNDIIKKGSMNSLMYDDVLENGTPFAEAVLENPMINNLTYESLGLKVDDKGMISVDTDGDGTPDKQVKVDADGDGKINQQEQQTLISAGFKEYIVDALINPNNDFYKEEVTRGIMANYFQETVAKQYNNKKQMSSASDRYDGLTTEELLAMYPPKK